MSVDLDLRLAPSAAAPGLARRSVRSLRGGIDPGALQTVQLLVSELVTNSVRHGQLRGADRIRLTVRSEPGRVHVAVRDPGRGFLPPDGGPHPLDASGWGLYFVDKLTDQWGVTLKGDTEVWFEIPST